MIDAYKNFAELEQTEKEDEDYTIFYREVDSEIAVIAVHGGGIEPGTIDIADALAGCDYTFYAFKGLKKTILFYKFVNTLKEVLMIYHIKGRL